MQSRKSIFEDFAKLMTNAAGVAQDATKEFETAVSSLVERVMARQGLVNREEFEAVRLMAIKAREENLELKEKLTELEGKITAKK
ncbi:MAG: accessory factor UbiK family protein [Paracoccaceae bacterium]|nr:accessory factor UbiK family protein [Paracoccaceae bacterium]MDE2739611.1 accessory factor UbiK family protein [Paracoccaceae bacterium]MDE2760233.1 accessory factor UbiK family protein [Paracoccaceae bacterium]MDE2916794.1 accessory factor UbiK family protein [Paracoccaceae bacterium]